MADKWHPYAHDVTAEEEKFIRDNYPRMNKKQIAEALQISRNVVEHYIRKNGLKRWSYRLWTDEECNVVREVFPKQGSKVCAKLLGRPYTAVQKKATELGLVGKKIGQGVNSSGKLPKRTYRDIAEYRSIVSKAIGRCLSADEIVHHLDGDPKNNSYDNLLITSSAGHTRIHWAMLNDLTSEELQDIVCSNGKTVRELLEASSS